MFKGLVAEIRG